MMAASKEPSGKPTSSAPLNCCQSNDSLTSNSTDQDQDVNICEAMNNFVISPKKKLSVAAATNNNSLLPASVKTYFPKREPVNLRFENIVYTSNELRYANSRIRFERKEILHGISGEFKSGELSVIMGPSGAGKSTLLNGLAGYISKGFTGKVTFNDEVRKDSPKFQKLVAYIFQDEELRMHLTVMENMLITADLKLGYAVSPAYKLNQVEELLRMLGLERCKNTLTSKLSGGQRKRLAIALELLSNPPILFLDEPTTGLDSLSCSQCIQLLKKLAHEGRTVICTIHQPSALLFEMFDHLYVLSEGLCIYDGKVPDLLPQLAQLGLECPTFHNPADFLMDVAIGEYGTDVDTLAELEKKKQQQQRILAKSAPQQDIVVESKDKVLASKNVSTRSLDEIVHYTTPKPANILMQFLLLYKRNLMIARRQYISYLNRVIAHIIIGILFGYLYRGVGIYAHTFLANYVYFYGSMLLVVYTGQMSVTLSFPLELNVLRREYFNRWYNLPPYLMSLLLVEIPFQVFCCLIYIAITYQVTGQLCDYRVFYFVLFCTLGTLCAQAWGYFIGSICSTSVSVFIGPVLACLFSVFGFCIRYDDTPDMFKWLYHVSYFRASFHGVAYAMNGLPRPHFPCQEDMVYCHYSDPRKFMREMGVETVNLWMNMTVVVVITFVMHASTYVSIWRKLNKR